MNYQGVEQDPQMLELEEDIGYFKRQAARYPCPLLLQDGYIYSYLMIES